MFAREGNDYRYNGDRGKDETLCNTKSRQKQEKLQRTQKWTEKGEHQVSDRVVTQHRKTIVSDNKMDDPPTTNDLPVLLP